MRKICDLPQFTVVTKYCGDCRLFNRCSQASENPPVQYLNNNKKRLSFSIQWGIEQKKKPSNTLFDDCLERMERNRIQNHPRLYALYNIIFGTDNKKAQKKQYQKEYSKRYYEDHKDPFACSDRLTSVQQCDHGDCLTCPYPDCIVPDVPDRKTYMRLYAEKNKEKLRVKKAEYREQHREDLRRKAREYYYNNYDECLKRNATYREAHKEERKQYDNARKERPDYKEKRRAYCAKYRDNKKRQLLNSKHQEVYND